MHIQTDRALIPASPSVRYLQVRVSAPSAPAKAGAPRPPTDVALVLEGAYEATLLAAALTAARTGSRLVFLTRLGGGAFGNDAAWIDTAMARAFDCVRDLGLDVRLVRRN